MSKINRYTKAMRQLKSPLKESVPTNSMQGIYVATPFVITPQPETLIQGVQADYTQDDSAGDTSGLFDAEGNQLTGVPPITIASPDNSYILGPMASMWYSWGNFSTFGYIRESDRRMVNLGSIQGPLHTWDKVSNFNSYGQLTLEQAVWFTENKKYGDVDNDYANANYRAFYPGPPSSSTDEHGRYWCTITGVPKDPDIPYKPDDKFTPGTNMSSDDPDSPLNNIVPGSANPNDGKKPWWDRLKDKFGDIADGVKDFVSDAFDNIAETIGDTVENVAETIGDIAENIGEGIEEVADWAQNTTEDVIDWAQETDWEAVSDAAGTVLNVADAAMTVGSIVGFFTPEPVTTAGGMAGLASVAIKFRNAYNASRGARGLARGLRGIKVGATGLKNKGFQNLRADLPGGPTGTHRGSGGLLSPGGQGAYSAPTVGGVRPGNTVKPGTGGSRYSHGGGTSNPIRNFFDRAAGKPQEGPGGVVGSVVPGGSRSTNLIEPQSVVSPAQFNRGTRMFNDIMNGRFPNSATANRLRNQGIKAGFKPGKSSIPFSDLPVLKNAVEYSGLYLNEEEQHSFRSILGEEESDKQDLMIMKLMNVPGFRKKLPAILKAMEEEIQIVELYQLINGVDESEGKKEDPFRKKQKKQQKESFYAPEKKKLLREIKQPYVMPEEKKVKLTGYKPKLPNQDKMRQLADSMNVPERVTFAKAETGTWKAGELERGRKSSQAKKNEVLELMGQGEESWVYMTETSRKRTGKAMYENFTLMNEQGVGTYKINRKEPLRSDFVLFLEYEDGTKSTMLQSELNEKMSDDSEKWRKDWKEPIKYEDQPAYKKVKKILSKEIPMKDIQPEFPKKAPPKLDPETQMHPDMFKRHDYFTKLDPDSAKTMAAAPTGDPKIDSEVEKAKKKSK